MTRPEYGTTPGAGHDGSVNPPEAADPGAAPTLGGPSVETAPAPESSIRPTRRRGRIRNLIEWVVVIGGALVVATLLRAFIFQTFYIPSGSMLQTLKQGDRVVVNKLDDSYGRGDIVVFERPDGWQGTHQDLIKRVIGLENETVEIHDNQVFIDGRPLTEPYLAADITLRDFPPTVVPDDQIFVMGDNRPYSSDSRENGPVPLDNVVGRAFIRIWPFSSFGRL